MQPITREKSKVKEKSPHRAPTFFGTFFGTLLGRMPFQVSGQFTKPELIDDAKESALDGHSCRFLWGRRIPGQLAKRNDRNKIAVGRGPRALLYLPNLNDIGDPAVIVWYKLFRALFLAGVSKPAPAGQKGRKSKKSGQEYSISHSFFPVQFPFGMEGHSQVMFLYIKQNIFSDFLNLGY